MNDKNKKLWNDFYKDGTFVMWYAGEPEIKFLSREFKANPPNLEGKKGLDLGCGVGRHTFLMGDFLMEVYGIDISKEAIFSASMEQLNRYDGVWEKNRIKFQVFDGKKIPFEDNFFDYIICNGVLDHMLFSEAKELVKEIKRVLKPNGKTIIMIHSVRDMHYMEGEKIEHNTFIINWGVVEFGLPQHYFSLEEIKEMFLDTELTIKKTYLHEDDYEGSRDSMWVVEIEKVFNTDDGMEFGLR